MLMLLLSMLVLLSLWSFKNLKWNFLSNMMLFMLLVVLILKLNLTLFPQHLGFGMGVDYLSMPLIMLTMLTCVLMMVASVKILFYNLNKYYFGLMVMLLNVTLIFSFSTMNLLMFYVLFEFSLIPTMILIMGWGYQPERLQAMIYLLFYTLFASFPLLIGIMSMYWYMKTMCYFVMMKFMLTISKYMMMYWLMCVLAFLVKLPLYMLHIWLPKAHVEAPISGSMILASILLKLGGYGMIRFSMIFKSIFYKFSEMFISVSLFGAVMTSLVCIRQIDMKSLIAYSSVGHMGLMISSVFIMSKWSISASIWMMVAHGLCSSGLFCLSSISYDRFNSRSMLIIKGMMNLFPSLSLFWFLLLIANMAAPPSLNLLSEIGIINSLIAWNSWSMIFVGFISFFSAVYSLYLYSCCQHGMIMMMVNYMKSIKVSEFMLLVMHLIPLNILVLKSEMMIMY